MAVIFSSLKTGPAAFRLSMASAYVGLLFLCASLMIGPWKVLRSRPNPVSTDLRRDVGIWAALLGLFHMGVGLQVHMGGKIWHYFFYPLDEPHALPFRHDLFGAANFAGLGATLVLILLLALSNNLALRTLGPARWKALQRWNYAGFLLVFTHGIAYQVAEHRRLFVVAVFNAIVLSVVAMQVAGFRKRGRDSAVAMPHRGVLNAGRS